VEADALDGTMNPADEKNTDDVDDLIQKVKARMNTFNDSQLDYANKAIKQRNITMLKNCLK
jgi:hypothetical protein